MPEVQLIEDIERYDPKKVSDKVLVDDHRLTHAWASTIKQGKSFKYGKDQVKALHDIIVVEMLKRKMKHNTPLNFKEYHKPKAREITQGLYLAPPHGELIRNGKKRALVKSRRIDMSMPYILVSGKLALGYIQLGPPKPINLNQFEKLERFHRITQKERERWWKDQRELFYYPIVKFIKMEDPMKVYVPRGTQSFIREVKLMGKANVKAQEKDFRKVDLKKLSESELTAFHKILHNFYHGRLPENATLEDLINSHELIKAEFKRRGMEHPEIGDGLDKEIKELKKLVASEVKEIIMNKLPNRIECNDYVCLIGSSVEGGHNEVNDIDILIQQNGFSPKIDKAISSKFPEGSLPHGLIFDQNGPRGQYVPIYKMVLEKVENFETLMPEHSLRIPWEGSKPSVTCEESDKLFDRLGTYPLSIEPHYEGIRLTVVKLNGKVQIFWRDKEVDIPELASELAKANLSEFAFEGIYQSDGKFYLTEPLKWRTSELISLAKDHSQFFLTKDAVKFSDKVIPTEFYYSDSTIELKNNLAILKSKGHSQFVLKHREEIYPAPGTETKHWLIFGDNIEMIEILKAFTPVKAIKGYHEAEYSKIDELFKFWAKGWFDKGQKIAVEPKFDGIRLVAHKKGDQVKIFTEDKKADRSHILPQLVEEIKGLPIESAILDSETVWWKDGKPIPRRDMIAIVTGKQPLGKEDIRMNIFDAVYLDDGKMGMAPGDMTSKPWTERQAILDAILPKNTQHLKRVEPIMAKDRAGLLSAIKMASGFPRSEGAMLKGDKGAYQVNGAARTASWAKFKVIFEITVHIIGKRLKEPGPKAGKTQTYLYYGAIKKGSKLIPIEDEVKRTKGIVEKEEKRPDKHQWKVKQGFQKKEGDYDFGTTYATNIDVPVGGHLTVAPAVVREWVGDDGKAHYSWIFPQVKEARPDRKAPDTVEEIGRFVKKLEKGIRASELGLQEGGLEKEAPTRQEEALKELEKLGNPYLVKQKPEKKYKWVMQYHVRGIPEDWTEEKIKRVLTGKERTTEKLSIHTDFRMESNKDFLVGWTMTTPGNLQKRDKVLNNQEKDNIVVIKKAVQPSVWLNVKGKVDPGEVGATKNTAGYFWPVAKGWLTYGIQKDDTHEYFLHPSFVADGFKSEGVGGRWQLSLIPRRPEFEKAGRKAVFWQMTRPLEQKPYIETHDKEKEEEKAKKDKIRMIWQ